MKRGVGSHDVFGLNPRLPRLPELGTAKPNGSGKRPATMSPPKHKPRAKPQPEPPDRRALDAAEAESRLIDVERRRDKALFADRLDAIAAEEKRLTSRRAAVEAEATAAERRYGALRSEADKVLKREEEAYAAAGKG